MMSKRHRQLRGIGLILLALLISYNIYIFGKAKVIEFLYPYKYEADIIEHSQNYNLDPLLVAAVINVESKFRPNAESPKGAKGLMQISDITADWAFVELGLVEEGYEKNQIFEPILNIRIGCWYLDKLRTEFGSKEELILAAYNGGSGNVTKWLKDPSCSEDGETLSNIPFSETSNYVKKVLDTYEVYKQLY